MSYRSSILDLRPSILDPRSSRCGFTIVELMISIAMVVILMVGIHQVFKMSSDTVGIGHAVGDMARNNRSVQGVFHHDYERLMKDAPLFIIRSGVAGDAASNNWGAFTTDAERSSDRDGKPLTQDLDGNGQEGQTNVNGEITPLSIYNNRNHRVDILGFPAHGLFHRHTGNDGTYSSQITSQDVFIFYEHVRLPTGGAGGAPAYFDPGDPAPGNLNNALASQWVLGRVALLMKDAGFIPNGEDFIIRNAGAPDLSPLRWNSIAKINNKYGLNQSRYDLLGLSLDSLRQDVADIRNSTVPDNLASTWWQPLVYKVLVPPNPPGNNAVNAQPVARFECNPRISKPITSEAMAKAMPVLLNNCSQFAVEYAGDFLTQDNRQFIPASSGPPGSVVLNPFWGQVTALEPDGVVDYVVDFSNAGTPPMAGTVSAKIRWYGLPRDTNGDGQIRGAGWNGGNVLSNDMVDVVPLRDVMATVRNRTNTGVSALLFANPPGPLFSASFERELPPAPPGGDYVPALTNPPGPAAAAFRYTCVWVNSAPTMIRLVVKLEDPAGRLPEGQWYEYVVGAP